MIRAGDWYVGVRWHESSYAEDSRRHGVQCLSCPINDTKEPRAYSFHHHLNLSRSFICLIKSPLALHNHYHPIPGRQDLPCQPSLNNKCSHLASLSALPPRLLGRLRALLEAAAAGLAAFGCDVALHSVSDLSTSEPPHSHLFCPS